MSPEKEEQIKIYIQKARDRGFSLSAIEEKLREAGYRAEHIRQLTTNFAHPETDQLIPAKHKFWLIAAAITLLIALSVTIWYFVPETCTDQECFVQQANSCGTATWQSTQSDTLIEHYVENCLYRRRVLRVSADEPETVRTLFEGKSLECPYEEFHPIWLSSLSLDLENCSGELKTAVDEILAAQRSVGII